MANSRNLTHRGPQQERVLDRDVILLRKLDTRKVGGELMNVLAGTRLGGDQKEGQQDWFLDGYIAADQPRDSMMSQLIVEHTVGYAIARTDSGEILATFPKKEFRRADEVARNARVELAVNVAMRESEYDDDDDESASADAE